MGKGTSASAVHPLRVLLKGGVLFVVLAFTFPVWGGALTRLSTYNWIVGGRLRLPYGGGNPDAVYSSSMTDLGVMLRSHVAARGKPAGEYRVIILGDSTVWGFSVPLENSLPFLLDAAGLTACDGRAVRVYNLGYPNASVTKDLLILDEAMQYQPDLVLWFVTLAAMTPDRRFDHPIITGNLGELLAIQSALALDLGIPEPADAGGKDTFFDRRVALNEFVRFELYGLMWNATGIDRELPDLAAVQRPALPGYVIYAGFLPPSLADDALSFDVIGAGVRLAGGTPVLLVNEPIYVQPDGPNTDIRYNASYPRWVYDEYRAQFAARAEREGWTYLDLWDALPPAEFTPDADLHPTPEGEALLAEILAPYILQIACGGGR
ncbi:MAG: hypothetical protein FD146_1817 [Anaerolineaceae bacterium]|nr:MAG: hypothetical protein FD146_1817 [Anaerolineaceae bacterium]